MRIGTTVAVIAGLLGAACTPRTAPPASAGRRVFDGSAIALAASPDGARLAWLSSCSVGGAPGRSVPGCALLVAPAEGGPAVKVADGVAASPGSFGWTPGGALAALARAEPGTGAGDLVLWRPGAEPRVAAAGASSFSAGPDMLAIVAGGEVLVASGAGELARLAGGRGAYEVAVAPGPGRAVAALARGADGSPVLLLWRGGAGEAVTLSRDVGSFAFSPDGAWLAAVAGVAPGSEGSLVAFRVMPAAGAPPDLVLVARAVGPFQWAPGSTRLAWLEGFDARGHAGRLASAQPGEAAVQLGDRVTSFELAPGGGQVAYVRHVTQGGYAANLELSPAAAAVPGTVASDAAGFAFSRDGKWLLYRAGCSPGGDGCALFRAPATGLGPSRSPERLAEGVAAFAVAPGRGERLLVAFVRRDGAGVDLSSWSGGRLTPLDGSVLPGSPVLLPPDGKRAAWVGTSAGRPGVHVADVP